MRTTAEKVHDLRAGSINRLCGCDCSTRTSVAWFELDAFLGEHRNHERTKSRTKSTMNSSARVKWMLSETEWCMTPGMEWEQTPEKLCRRRHSSSIYGHFFSHRNCLPVLRLWSFNAENSCPNAIVDRIVVFLLFFFDPVGRTRNLSHPIRWTSKWNYYWGNCVVKWNTLSNLIHFLFGFFYWLLMWKYRIDSHSLVGLIQS